MEKFVALDFETSYGKHACSIGLVEFVNGCITRKYYSLIKPKINYFNPINKSIHGISENDVKNEKDFKEIWDIISDFFINTNIVAHNYSFDISVLKFNLELYEIEMPNFQIFCTLKLTRKYLNLESNKLNFVAKHFNILQNEYHNALEDAEVCGKIFLELKRFESDNNQFIENGKGKVVDNQLIVKKKFRLNIDYNRNKNLYFENFILTQKSNKLNDKKFVVSGVFEKFSRDELKLSIENNGGIVASSISKNTDFVIAGDKMGPEKRKKAETLGVSIITENEYILMLS